MFKSVMLAVVLFSALNANAEVFKCQGVDGKKQFSDTPCKAGDASEVVPDRAPVTEQQRHEAQQRARQMQDKATAVEPKKSADPSEQANPKTESARATGSSTPASSDSDAMASCVRDVERQPASQNVKAEMIAACRTAGVNQRATGMTAEMVSDCVRSVERTGATGGEKARQLALCHGGDVRQDYRRKQ